MEKTCPYCLKSKDEAKFRPSVGGKPRNVCRACQAEYEYIRIKTDVLNAYGRKCKCCGADNPLFLGLDHVAGNGNLHRRQTGYITAQMYRLARRLGYPDTFQLLCHNCNLAKGFFRACPHQSGRTTDLVWKEWEEILARKGKRFRFYQEKLNGTLWTATVTARRQRAQSLQRP
jgi:hypothetical protein